MAVAIIDNGELYEDSDYYFVEVEDTVQAERYVNALNLLSEATDSDAVLLGIAPDIWWTLDADGTSSNTLHILCIGKKQLAWTPEDVACVREFVPLRELEIFAAVKRRFGDGGLSVHLSDVKDGPLWVLTWTGISYARRIIFGAASEEAARQEQRRWYGTVTGASATLEPFVLPESETGVV